VADGYRLVDYGGTIERVLWQAEHDPVWLSLLLQPWHGYTFRCTIVGCDSGAVHLPVSSTWHSNSNVQTVSYGTESIVYSVNVSEPVLMVENELAIRGWRTNTPRVRSVKVGIPLRAWRLSPGRYRFTATYHQSGRTPQELALVVALAAWLGCGLLLRYRPLAHSGQEIA
jgi:hypothetical protein